MSNEKIKLVPLSKLSIDVANVRQSHDTESVRVLADNILHGGLQQSLLVRKTKKGYGVIAGGRRLKALTLLQEEQKIQSDFEVPVLVFAGSDEEAKAASLSENTQRQNMSDAEQIIAFGKIHNKGQGLSIEDIASRYRIGVRRVRATLAMNDLPDEVIAMLQNSQISLKRLEAMANCRCKERVAEAISRMDEFWHDHAFAQFLSQNEVNGDNHIAKFVGLDTYKKAGGQIREDLFTTDEDVIFEDLSLLKTLANEKLNTIAEEYKSDGWSNVEVYVVGEDAPYAYSYEALKPELKEFSKTDQKTISQLETEYQRLEKELEQEEEEGSNEDIDAELESVEQKIQEIKTKYHFFSDEQKQSSTVEIALRHHSERVVYIRKPSKGEKSNSANGVKPKKPDYTKAVMGDLLDIKTLSLQGAVAQDTKIAKILLISSLLRMVENRKSGLDAVDLRHENKRSFLDHPENPAGKICNGLFDELQGKYKLQTNNPTELISNLQNLDHPQLDQILALLFASQINLNAWATEPREVAGAQELCELVSLDITTVYEVDEDMLKRISRPVIESAVKEAGNDDNYRAVTACKSKKDAVSLALPILQRYGWLPPVLRTENYRLSKEPSHTQKAA